MNESELLFSMLADLNLLFGHRPSIKDYPIRVRFTNGIECKDDLYLIGEQDRPTGDGPICTKYEYENCRCSFAYLTSDGRVMQYGEQVATRSDLLIWNSLQLHE